MSIWDIPNNVDMSRYESPLKRIFDDYESKIVKAEEDRLMIKVKEVLGVDIDKEELTKALMYDRNQYIIGYGNCLKDHMTGKWNPEDGITRPHTDNRGAEPKDVTDENYHKDYDTISCPHCGCTLSNFVVMPDHYCYVCGGQFGRKLITEVEEE